MRSARIRTAWRNKCREISVEEHAAAVAAAAWRVALNAAKNLHEVGFEYTDDAQRLGVMREYLCFFVHLADRRAQRRLDAARRGAFVAELARECARHYLENQRDIMAQGVDADSFIAQLNRRAAEYAATRFIEHQPGGAAYRLLGARVQDCMGDSQTNKWTQDQVTEIDGPAAWRIFDRALAALNDAARGGED